MRAYYDRKEYNPLNSICVKLINPPFEVLDFMARPHAKFAMR